MKDWFISMLEKEWAEPRGDIGKKLEEVEIEILSSLNKVPPISLSASEEEKITFLVATGSSSRAAALAERWGLSKEFQAEGLRNLLLSGGDSDIQKFPCSREVFSSAVRGEMKARLAAVVQILCDDESEFHSLFFFSVPQVLLTQLLSMTVSSETLKLVERVGHLPALMSIVALGSLPNFISDQESEIVKESAGSLIRGITE